MRHIRADDVFITLAPVLCYLWGRLVGRRIDYARGYRQGRRDEKADKAAATLWQMLQDEGEG